MTGSSYGRHRADSGQAGGPDHFPDDLRGMRDLLDRDEASLEVRICGDIGFELVAVFKHRLLRLAGKILLRTDQEVGLLNDDFELNKVIGPDGVSVGPLFKHHPADYIYF